MACPLYGTDDAFAGKRDRGFASSLRQDLAGMQRAGYECLDTTQALESCGGCGSMDDSELSLRTWDVQCTDTHSAASQSMTAP